MRKVDRDSVFCTMGKWAVDSGQGTVSDYELVMRRKCPGVYYATFAIQADVILTPDEWYNFTNDLTSPNEWLRGYGSTQEDRDDLHRAGVLVANEHTKEIILVDPEGTETAAAVGFLSMYVVPDELAGRMVPMGFMDE